MSCCPRETPLNILLTIIMRLFIGMHGDVSYSSPLSLWTSSDANLAFFLLRTAHVMRVSSFLFIHPTLITTIIWHQLPPSYYINYHHHITSITTAHNILAKLCPISDCWLSCYQIVRYNQVYISDTNAVCLWAFHILGSKSATGPKKAGLNHKAIVA